MTTSNGIQRSLGRIEGKLDTLAKSFGSVENRLNKVENRQYWILGAGAATAAVVSGVWNWLLRG